MHQVPLDRSNWWTSLDEDYWQALLEQGENAPETIPPSDASQIFYALGLESSLNSPQTQRAPDGKVRPGGNKWKVAQAAFDRGDLFHLKVSGANRGGLLVDWNGLQGFVPASHLKEMPRCLDSRKRVSELVHRVGDSLTLRLIEVDERQNRLVFSERAAHADSRSPEAILSALRPGDVCQGTVTNLTTFGAFVDLGGIEGLIHVSELSWERVRHPSDVLHPGQEIKVCVLGVNPAQGRIALSLKQLHPDPWTEVEARYQVGQIIEGTISSVVSFGAFVRIAEGVEGLIHVSELAEGNFLHPRNVVREGDVVCVRVLNIDTVNHRLGLSLRRAHGTGFSS